MVTGLMGLLMLALPFSFVVLILWLAQNRKRDRHAKQAEVQKEIIGKFASGAEMQAFLKSEEGRALFRDFGAAGGESSRSLREVAISRIGIGIVLIVVGAGLAVLSHYADQPEILTSQLAQSPPPGTLQEIPAPPAPPPGPLIDVPPGTGLPAAALFLTGIGLLISALLTLRLATPEKPKN